MKMFCLGLVAESLQIKMNPILKTSMSHQGQKNASSGHMWSHFPCVTCRFFMREFTISPIISNNS